jgi:hypothetical protein
MKPHNPHRKKNTFDEDEMSHLLGMLSQLPTVPAPRGFERSLYRRLGIAYFPRHRKVLAISGLGIFACSVYLAGKWFLGAISSRLTLAGSAQFFTAVYTKIMQAVSIIKIGYHLKEIFLAFANPWVFVGLAIVSSVLMLMLIGVVRGFKRKAVLLSTH